MNPLFIDCDTGRDDALSLWLSLAMGLPLAAVMTSYGNTTLENVTENTARVLSLVGRDDLPLFALSAMASRPHKGLQEIVFPRQKAAGNGLCNVTLPPAKREKSMPVAVKEAAEKIAKMANDRGPLDYIVMGPATNLAALLKVWGKEAPSIINRVTMMGGKFSPLWEEIPGADFNILCDPWAVQDVLESGVPARFVPMNFTWPVFMSLSDIESLKASSPVASCVRDLMIAYCRHFAPEPLFRFHDPCAVLAAMDDEGFNRCSLKVNCEEASPDFGRMNIDDKYGIPAFIYKSDLEKGQKFKSRILKELGLSSSSF